MKSEEYGLSYDIDRIRKVDKDVARYARYDLKRDKKSKKKLRSALQTGEVVFVLFSRIKKDASYVFYLSSMEKESFFNKDKKFVTTKRFENYRGTEFYRIQELQTGRKTEGRFLRKELFTLENNVQ